MSFVEAAERRKMVAHGASHAWERTIDRIAPVGAKGRLFRPSRGLS